MLSKKDQIRLAAEQSLSTFIKLVHPGRVLGSIHEELISWWTREEAKQFQLVLLPRDHQKSALIAYRVAWEITKNPALRILYISSTSNLAVKQLKFIKDILTSDIYRMYWPEMVHEEEAKREKWSETEFSVDHPLRKIEAIREPTCFTAGLTTVITGLHCDIAVLDDVVVSENASTQEGRTKVESQYSLLSSIEGADAREWVVGTRYHPQDLYQTMLSMMVEKIDEYGEIIDVQPLYEVFERQVESVGDGSGQYLWPRQLRYDGKWFGFNQEILAIKRAKYKDQTQFRAQYYNDPNDTSTAPISRDYFQYYDPKFLHRYEGRWYYQGNRLNVFASIDFAYSLSNRSDYSAVVVVGIDANQNYYVLDIERFKTTRIKDYFDAILKLHNKWDFRKLRAEVTAAQAAIVQELKESYIRPYGLALSVDDNKPSRHEGAKEERIKAALQSKFENRQIWFYRGGNCQILEEELVLQNPPHDDIKDCLASVMGICVAPTIQTSVQPGAMTRTEVLKSMTNSRFGGLYG